MQSKMNQKALLGLTAVVLTSMPAQSGSIIESQLQDTTEVLLNTGYKLVIDCRTKTDNLSKAEVATLINRMRIDKSALQDPYVILLAKGSKQYLSKDCRTINKNGMSEVLSEINRTYAISFLGTIKPKQGELSLKRFSAASRIWAAIKCRDDKGEFSSPKQRTDAMRRAAKKAGVPLYAFGHRQVIESSMQLAEEMDSTCSGFRDSEKAAELVMKHFNGIY